jgi:hypothetical protein
MPFTSVLGASSVIKPGVCTSSTRPSAPYVGQLVFETNTNRLVVFTASGWVYQTARVTGATFTAATSVVFPNSTFTSSSNSYQVVLALTAFPSSASTVTMQVRDNSGTKSSAQYIGAISGRRDDGAATGLSTSFATSFSIGTAFVSGSVAPYALVLTVNNPANASFPTSWSGTGFGAIGGDPRSSILVGGHYNVSEAHTGLVFSFSVAVTGYYNVYSLADS